VVSYRRRNHPRQILSRLVKGLGGYGSPKSGVSHWLWMSLLQQGYALTCYTVMKCWVGCNYFARSNFVGDWMRYISVTLNPLLYAITAVPAVSFCQSWLRPWAFEKSSEYFNNPSVVVACPVWWTDSISWFDRRYEMLLNRYIMPLFVSETASALA